MKSIKQNARGPRASAHQIIRITIFLLMGLAETFIFGCDSNILQNQQISGEETQPKKQMNIQCISGSRQCVGEMLVQCNHGEWRYLDDCTLWSQKCGRFDDGYQCGADRISKTLDVSNSVVQVSPTLPDTKMPLHNF